MNGQIETGAALPIVSLRQHPEQLERFLAFFVRHWHNEAVYRDCLTASLSASAPLPQWYLLENRAGELIGGAGLITNDFISRMDLCPWLCALYIESACRGHAFGAQLIDHVRTEAARLGYDRLYLCTSHIGYYEKYGFEYLADGVHPWGERSRIYRAETGCRDRENPIRPVPAADFEEIFAIINDAAAAYKGIIPADRWHEPYMPREELRDQIADGVVFYGYYVDGKLIGVMGVQDKNEVNLIRHAYVRTASRKHGIGGKLLQFLHESSTKPMLIGTWADAVWAIRFYEKHGFRRVDDVTRKNALLRQFWNIPERQVETSVVLTDGKL